MLLDSEAGKRADNDGCPITGLAAGFDPFVEPYLSDPYPFWLRAREQEPVFYSPQIDYWVVTRYEDIKAIFSDPQTFSAGNAQTPIRPLAPQVTEMLRDGGLKTKPVMSNCDPPTHARIRKHTWGAFTPKRVAQLEAHIRALVTRYIDRIEKHRHADLVQDMFYELPVHVLFIFLGMPEKDIGRIKSWSRKRLMLTWGQLSDAQQMVEAQGLLEYWKYTEAFVDSLLADPPDNYVGDLIRVSQADEDQLTIDEITNIVYGLVLAGHETTTSMSSNAILTLMQHRDVWQRLCVEPQAIPNAVEELLRFNSSVITWRRKTTRPVEIANVAIPEDANLLLALCSGNCDGKHFADPEKFDIDRPNVRSHLSFGFGIHFCLGAPLARLELKIILEELVRRLPDLRLSDNQTWSYPPNTTFRGPEQLWVEW
jgi:cytochrome P450